MSDTCLAPKYVIKQTEGKIRFINSSEETGVNLELATMNGQAHFKGTVLPSQAVTALSDRDYLCTLYDATWVKVIAQLIIDQTQCVVFSGFHYISVPLLFGEEDEGTK